MSTERPAMLVLLAVVLSACIPQSATPPSSSSPSVAVAPTATPTGTSSPDAVPSITPGPTPRTTTFPDVALIAGGILGELQVYRGGRWTVEAQICPNADPHNAITILEVAADGRTVFAQCAREIAGSADRDVRDGFVYDLVTKQKRPVAGTRVNSVGPLSPDGGRVVVGGAGDCPMPAPVCQERHFLLDLATGARQEILPSDYWLGIEFRWSSLGLTYFRPECAPAGCAGTAKSGTYAYSFTTKAWTRISPHRVIATSSAQTLLEDRRSLHERETPVRVIELVLGQERRLTPARVEQESALALLPDGGVVAWRPDVPGSYDGHVIVYRDGRESLRTRGRFSGYFNAAGRGWVFSGELSGAPSWTIQAYSVEQQAFASLQPTFRMQQFRLLRTK